MTIGSREWVVAEGYIPKDGVRGDSRLEPHEALCIVNTGPSDANLELTVFFADRDPAGPYRVKVPSRRTLHLRTSDLEDPEPIPRDTDYSVMILSDREVVVQHSRLDSRRGSLALLSTLAYSGP